jgi:hypothetical protein
MTELVIVAAVAAVAVAVAWVVQRRRPDAPVRTGWSVPEQLDRADFDRPDAPWLVAVFTSATCSTCADVLAKAEVLASDDVVVQAVGYQRDGALHARYAIDAGPSLVIVDDAGVVRRSFLGPVSATHLWAALAELREPGAVPPGCGA